MSLGFLVYFWGFFPPKQTAGSPENGGVPLGSLEIPALVSPSFPGQGCRGPTKGDMGGMDDGISAGVGRSH